MTAALSPLALGDVQWLVVCYVLVYGSLMLVCGKLGDLFGHRRIFRIGLLASAVGCAACAVAPDWVSFLGARVAQGVGTALALSCTPALATSLLSMAASRISAEIERLESDKALLSSRERLALAVEGSQLALWDLNVATGEVFISERWGAMAGESPEATQTTLAKLFGAVHPEDQQAVERAYRDVLTGAVPFYGVTHRVQRADGTVIWVRSHGKVSQRDANGRALRLVGT